jgi:hypothetical protein
MSDPDVSRGLDQRPRHAPPRRHAKPQRRRSPLHFVVVVLLVVDIMLGLGLAFFAEEVISYRPIAIMGFGLAALGLGILAYFVVFGARAEQRKRARRNPHDVL